MLFWPPLLATLAAQASNFGQFVDVAATVTGRLNGGSQFTANSTASGDNGATWTISNYSKRLETGLSVTAASSYRRASASLSETAQFRAQFHAVVGQEARPTRGFVKIDWASTASATAGIIGGTRATGESGVTTLKATASAPKNGGPNDAMTASSSRCYYWQKVQGPWSCHMGYWTSAWSSVALYKLGASATAKDSAGANGGEGVTVTYDATDASSGAAHAMEMTGTNSLSEGCEMRAVIYKASGELIAETFVGFQPQATGPEIWTLYHPLPGSGDYVVKLTRPGYLTQAYTVHVDGHTDVSATYARKFGDLTGDNKIDSVDLGIANRLTGKTEFDESLEPGDSTYFQLLDKDEDGYVSLVESAPVNQNQRSLGD